MDQEEQPIESEWPPSTELVSQAQAGEDIALKDLYRLMRPRLRSFLRYQGFGQSASDDLIATITETILNKIGTLRNTQAFEAWFWTLTRNHVRGYLRTQKRVARLSELQGPTPVQPLETLLLQEEHQAVRAALAELSPQDRELLWLREVEGLSYRELGGTLGAASGAIRVRCHRARQRLHRAYLVALGGPPE